jgi:hypothetical protein
MEKTVIRQPVLTKNRNYFTRVGPSLSHAPLHVSRTVLFSLEEKYIRIDALQNPITKSRQK